MRGEFIVVFSRGSTISHGTDTGKEWAEIHNYGPVPIDVSGWRLCDNNNAPFIIPAGTIMPPQGVIILAQNKGTFQSHWLGGQSDSRVIGGVPFNFNNGSGDQVVLKDAGGTVVWTLGYTSADANVG